MYLILGLFYKRLALEKKDNQIIADAMLYG
jgi:hypothetical protein